MNLTQFKSADDAVRLTIRLSIGYCVLLTLAFVSCLIYLSVQIEKPRPRHWSLTGKEKSIPPVPCLRWPCASMNT